MRLARESTPANSNLTWNGSTILLLCTGALVLCRLWILPLGNSYWLDETVVAHLVRNDLNSTIHQAFIGAQPVTFSVVEWFMRHLGDSEIVLRLPSVVASVGSLIVLYRIGTEAIDADAGVILAGVHLTLAPVAAQAANARPYALALFFEYLSILFLLRWVRSGKHHHGLLWIASAVIATHFHHLFVIALGAEFAFACMTAFRGRVLRFRDLVWYGLIGAAGLLPALPQLVLITHSSGLFSWVPIPIWISLPIALLPAFALIGAGLMAGFAKLNGDRPKWKPPEHTALAWLGVFLLVPVFVFFLLAQAGSVNLFAPRYLLPTTCGSVLLFGWMLRGVEPILVRRMSLVLALVLAGAFTSGFSLVPDYNQEHWREAIRDAPASGGMLVYSGLVEARRLDWLQDPEHWGYLISPVLYYRPSLSPDDTFVLPFEFGPEEKNYMETLMDARLHDYDRLTIIGRKNFMWSDWESWLAGRLAATGYRKLSSAPYGSIQVDVYERKI